MKSIINEAALSRIVRESIKKVLNEQSVDRNRLYTLITKPYKKYLDTVFSDGLKCRDNGEADGIWFSRGHLFYNYAKGFLFSLPYTDEVRRIGGFDTYDWENNASVIVAHKDIPIECLTLEMAPAEAWKYDGSDKWEYTFHTPSERSEWYLRPDGFRKSGNDMHFVIFKDMYEHLFGHPVNEREYDGIPNLEFDNFLFNDRWHM